MANATSGDITIDMSQVRKLALDLKRSAPLVEKELHSALTAAGELVAVKARSNIAPYSSRIGKTVKTRRRGVGVRVEAGGARAPHAAPFEHGGKPGEFRAPLFGDKSHWYPHKAHPFLLDAAEEEYVPFATAVLAAVDVAVLHAGL